MSTLSPRESLAALRHWTARSAEHLAAAATLLLERLGLEPAPETTATPRLTARTIRYYVAEGLLSPPEGQTRRAVYRYRHLLEVLWIKAAQARGQALDDIRRELHSTGGAGARDVAELETALLRRLPDRAPLPLPGGPVDLDRAVSLRLGRPLDRPAEAGVVTPRANRPAAFLKLLRAYLAGQNVLDQRANGSDADSPAGTAVHDPGDRPSRSFTSPGGDARFLPESAMISLRPGPHAPYKPSGLPRPEAALQIQVHLGQGIRLIIPADHPLAEEILDRGLTVADLDRLLHMDEPPAGDDQRRQAGDPKTKGEEERA